MRFPDEIKVASKKYILGHMVFIISNSNSKCLNLVWVFHICGRCKKRSSVCPFFHENFFDPFRTLLTQSLQINVAAFCSKFCLKIPLRLPHVSCSLADLKVFRFKASKISL